MKFFKNGSAWTHTGSHPTRGAWIEIECLAGTWHLGLVAPHTGCVD